MDFSWRSSGGLVFGGECSIQLVPGDTCRLVLNSRGLRNTLLAGRSVFEALYNVGLYQNDFTPRVSMLTTDIAACNFSGYAGLAPTFSWSVPAYSGGYASMTAHEIVWGHNGGPVGNFVYGYYVLDNTGELVWAERFCPAPMRVYRLGERVRMIPTLYLVNDLVV